MNTPTENHHATAEELAQHAGEFVTLPDIYARIRDTLNDPASTHTDIAEVLSTDPALTARVLKIANSAFYGRSGTIAKISQAVSLLGTQQVHDLVLATVVIAGTAGLHGSRSSLRNFWRLSLTLASAAKLIAEDCGILDAERVFVAGLISQLGQLVVDQALADDSQRLRQQAETDDLDLATLQRETFGFDHAAVAAALFKRWNLPTELIEPIQWHTQPDQAGDRDLEASILNIATALSRGIISDVMLDDMLSAFNESAWQTTELSRERLMTLRDETQALTQDMAPILLDLAA
jgi:HD-like signal output (HDOD) protein